LERFARGLRRADPLIVSRYHARTSRDGPESGPPSPGRPRIKPGDGDGRSWKKLLDNLFLAWFIIPVPSTRGARS
jgi:hypothetical protein